MCKKFQEKTQVVAQAKSFSSRASLNLNDIDRRAQVPSFMQKRFVVNLKQKYGLGVEKFSKPDVLDEIQAKIKPVDLRMTNRLKQWAF